MIHTIINLLCLTVWVANLGLQYWVEEQEKKRKAVWIEFYKQQNREVPQRYYDEVDPRTGWKIVASIGILWFGIQLILPYV